MAEPALERLARFFRSQARRGGASCERGVASRLHDEGMGLDGSDGGGLCRIRDGIYADDLVLAAVARLDVFGWLVDHAVDFEGLCKGLDLAPRPADVMCTLPGNGSARSGRRPAPPDRPCPQLPCQWISV